MHPATPNADRAIVDGVDTLTRLAAELKALRANVAALRLPADAANDRLKYSDKLLAIVSHQIAGACEVMAGDFGRILREDSARYDAANDDDQLEDVA